MSAKVIAHPIGKKLHRSEIWSDGKLIGEYERAQANDIERKTAEIHACLAMLEAIEHQHGLFVVRSALGRTTTRKGHSRSRRRGGDDSAIRVA